MLGFIIAYWLSVSLTGLSAPEGRLCVLSPGRGNSPGRDWELMGWWDCLKFSIWGAERWKGMGELRGEMRLKW